jgi:hypothetical protein
MKYNINIEDETIDEIMYNEINDWIEYYKREIKLLKSGKDRIPVKYTDPKKDLKFLKKKLKSWKAAKEEFNYLEYYQE